MQRQRSILSFFPRPSSENRDCEVDRVDGQRAPQFTAKPQNQNARVGKQLTASSNADSSFEIRGTETPPEKVPRQIFPTSFAANDDIERPSLFSSIKHKFVKIDGRAKTSSERNQVNGGCLDSFPISSKLSNQEQFPSKDAVSELPGKGIVVNPGGKDCQGDKDGPLLLETDDGILGPETPGMRPLVPRLKRIQEGSRNFEGESDCSLLVSSKRVKLPQDLKAANKCHEDQSEFSSKFEWLDPSRIRDSNGRRPDDALYDKRTLHIPPDALKKMSASQKQYWDVKSRYMDVVLFFKVGKFYELYELDAEIGHKELDWKITMSGVGKCRQVGISESGIDDAIQKLIARGYKVGRMEQLETSEQAKARGSTSVIQRKLVSVLTPSTTVEGNAGPDSVHLLAIREGNSAVGNGSTAYGFAFVDCAALKFWVGSISDDASCAALGALLMQDVEEINCRLNAVGELMKHSEIMLLSAQYLRKLPDLERLLGRVKACFQSSASLLLPLIGRKVLKQRVKAFGSLVKGLRVAVDLLVLIQNDKHVLLSFSKLLKLPMLSGNDGIDKFLSQFEAAVESDFPKYQDHDVKDSDDEILSFLIELFIEKAVEWSQISQAIDCIDVLRSFAVTANSACGTMSKPVILPVCKSDRGPILKIKGLWHPYALGENGELPVPNDIELGEDADGYQPRTLLLTGPNMGGKSTLLRATCLAVIMAQLGSYVPCEMCVLSLVDVIFTRLGATDRIMTGESTFFIECTETASVLQNATQDSLVLLDELGRGTSTFDGYAIAYAVFRHLVEKVNCRLLFATHYHPLTKEFACHPHVKMQHMACAFRSKSKDSFQSGQELVFLYRLTSGACPESYGMQVALMAGIPKQVVEAAFRAGQVMKEWIGESFKSTEQRSEFSTLHEEWLKTLSIVSRMREDYISDDTDAFDTLFCLWHELKSSYKLGK